MFIFRTKYYLILFHLLDLTVSLLMIFKRICEIWVVFLLKKKVSQKTQLAELVTFQQKWHLFLKKKGIAVIFTAHINSIMVQIGKSSCKFISFSLLRYQQLIFQKVMQSICVASIRRWNSDKCRFSSATQG